MEKKKILGLVIGFLLIGVNVFAADGDLIVNGNIGIGTTSPGARLDINGTGGILFNVENAGTSYFAVNATTGRVGDDTPRHAVGC